MANLELSRRDRQADMMHKRELKEKELKLEEAKLEARERAEITRKEESEAQRKSEFQKNDALSSMVSQQAQILPMLMTTMGEIAKFVSRN